MKKTKYIIFFSAFIFLFGACSEEFLEVENRNSFAEEEFYSSISEFQLALNSCYAPLQGIYAFNAQFLQLGFSDRILHERSTIDPLLITSSTDFVGDIWRNLYFGYYRVNKFILEITDTDVFEGNVETRNLMEAQARALRGMYNFIATTYYDRPIFYNEESFPQNLSKDFANGEPIQFYEQIEEDLNFAINYLPIEWESDDDLGRITKGGASALLGKALIFKHYYIYGRNNEIGSAANTEDLQKAKEALEDVMTYGYELIMPQDEPGTNEPSREDYLYAYLSNFSYVNLVTPGGNEYKAENNAESVWEVQYSDVFARNPFLPGWMSTGNLNHQYFSPAGSFKNIEWHPEYFYHFEETGPLDFDRDPRAYACCFIDGDIMDYRPGFNFYNTPYNSFSHSKLFAFNRKIPGVGAGAPINTISFGFKKHNFPPLSSSDDVSINPEVSPNNWRLIRYAEVLLLYSEVTLLLNQDMGAGLDALNQVRARMGMPAIANLTRDAVIAERDNELGGELKRYMDLVRWGMDPSWNIDYVEIFGDNRFRRNKNEFLPIPIREIQLNDGELVQNPGY